MSVGAVALTGDRSVESSLWCESSGARQNGSSPALRALETPWAGRVARPALEGELAVPSDSAGRDWGQEEKGTTEDEMAGWRHGLDGRESE